MTKDQMQRFERGQKMQEHGCAFLLMSLFWKLLQCDSTAGLCGMVSAFIVIMAGVIHSAFALDQ